METLLTSGSQIQLGTVIKDVDGTEKIVTGIMDKIYSYTLIGWDGKPSRWCAGYDLLANAGKETQFIVIKK